MIRTVIRGVGRMRGLERGKGLAGFSEGRKGTEGEKDEGKNMDRFSKEQRDRKKELVERFVMMTFAGVSGYMLYNYLYNDANSLPKSAQQPAKPAEPLLKLGGSWSLIDTDSQPFTSDQLSGQYYLIYFGFTKCPDICPTTLQYLSTVQQYVQSFPLSQLLPLKIVFVSVDPERDEPVTLKQYLSNFKADIIGVTGLSKDDQNLKDCLRKFKIYANRVDTANGYNVDHTTMVYLLDGNSRYLDHINPTLPQKDTALQLITKIRQHLAQPPQNP